jgi:hypothetical protein
MSLALKTLVHMVRCVPTLLSMLSFLSLIVNPTFSMILIWVFISNDKQWIGRAGCMAMMSCIPHLSLFMFSILRHILMLSWTAEVFPLSPQPTLDPERNKSSPWIWGLSWLDNEGPSLLRSLRRLTAWDETWLSKQ